MGVTLEACDYLLPIEMVTRSVLWCGDETANVTDVGCSTMMPPT